MEILPHCRSIRCGPQPARSSSLVVRSPASCLRPACRTSTPQHLQRSRPPLLQLTRSTISDSTVPEGHVGLHSTLYGEGGAERHDATNEYSIRKGEDDGSKLLPVDAYVGSRDGEKPLGVYALYNCAQQVQYVGYARNMVLAIKAHLKRVGPERCSFVRAMVFANKSMATRQNMEREVQNWISEFEQTPVGNDAEKELWEGSSSISAMSEVERGEYVEKQLKLKKAMGEKMDTQMADERESDAERRLKFMAAIQNDDWSAVIDGQTRGTQGAGAAGEEGPSAGASGARPPRGPREAAASSAGGSSTSGNGNGAVAVAPMVSPFTKAAVHRTIGESVDLGDGPAAMNVESVDKALEQVRPYLISDGGNVEVADVTNGVVFLRLEGACNTCSSSATTMRMGIERALQATFGDQLKEVIQVSKGEASVISVTTVDTHLDKLRGAISGAGGKVQVVDVKQGTCVIKYSGPAAIGKGIAAAIKDTFARDIKEVLLVGF